MSTSSRASARLWAAVASGTAATALALCLAANATAADPVPVPPPPPPGGPPPLAVLPPEQVDPRVAAAYAERFHVTFAEAVRRLKLQRRMGDLDNRLRLALADRYAGVHFDNAEGVAVAGALAAEDEEQIRSEARREGIAEEDLRVERAQVSYDDLTALSGKVVDSVRHDGDLRWVTVGVQVDAGTVLVNVADDAPRAVKARMADRQSSRVRVREMPAAATRGQAQQCSYPHCAPPLRGAVRMGTEATNTCSVGYIGYTRTEWVVFSAGHCARIRVPWSAYNINTRTWRRIGTPGPWYYEGRGDAGIFWTNRSDCGWCWSTTPVVAAWTANEGHVVRGRAWAQQWTFVCRYGATSQLSCGTVLVVNQTVTYPREGVTLGGMIETDACGLGGDSGGPLMQGGLAIGIHSGATDVCGAGQRTWSEEVVDAEAVLGAWVHSQS